MKAVKRNNKGFILASLLIITAFITLTISYVASLSLTTLNLAQRDIQKANAQMTADAALDIAMTQLNTVGATAYNSSYSSETTFLSQGSLTTTYQIALIDGATSEQKTLAVISRAKINGVTQSTRRYELDVSAVTTGLGNASVVSGVGGLQLNNNAKITGGDVVVNGVINISNNAQIGLSTNPVNVRSAHQVCPNPANSSYPSVCASGENGQPITIDNNGLIYGNVQATNQTNGSRMSNPGLVPNSSFSPLPMPSFDRDALKSAVTTTINGNVTSCSSNARTFGTGPTSVTKINGNLDPPNNCKITINGSLWITGRISTGNNVEFIVPTGQGSTRPNVMVDGSNGITLGNNFKVTTNTSGTGIYFITYYSRASCSPDCANVTGSDLANSINDVTLTLSNNASANASILYARWSKVRVQNNGNLGAISGMTVELSNNAVINFTASVPGSSNLVTTWAKRGYMRVYQ